MPTTHEVASELRKLADSLTDQPETETDSAFVMFSQHSRQSFVIVSKALPKPAEIYMERGTLRKRYRSDAITIINSISQELICEMIEPAKPAVYRPFE